MMVLLLPASFLLCYGAAAMDNSLGIPGGGLSGFLAFPSNHPGINTPQISVIISPWMFLVGAILGLSAGLVRARRNKRQDG
jgi:hypothetical protein